MRFDYTVDKNPNDLDLLDNKEFIDYIGDILIELLEEKLEEWYCQSQIELNNSLSNFFIMKIILERFYLLLKKNTLTIELNNYCLLKSLNLLRSIIIFLQKKLF
jgi:hypothetical protein